MDIDDLDEATFSTAHQSSWLSSLKESFNAAAAWFKIGSYGLASYLTDSACKVHELFREFSLVDLQHAKASFPERAWKKLAIFSEAIVHGLIATFTTIPAVAIRAIASRVETEKFIYDGDPDTGKNLPLDRHFSMLSWNVCCVGGGYTITDGGVSPWPTRVDALARKMIESNADVNCLYEAYDVKTCALLTKHLKTHGYAHFYFNMGAKAVGPSSGIFVASKYRIANAEFTPFPQEALTGRTKMTGKGVFSFDLESQGESFARIHATHLQHSEIPQFPTQEEVDARRMQMQVILDKIDQNKLSIVTGDLNLDDDEYRSSDWAQRFTKGSCEYTDKTWGGDEFCARMTGKQISAPLNLDHTIVSLHPNRSDVPLATRLIGTGFDPAVYKEGELALSDHDGLLSVIYSPSVGGQEGPTHGLGFDSTAGRECGMGKSAQISTEGSTLTEQIGGRPVEEVLAPVNNTSSNGIDALDNKESVLPEERYGSGPDQIEGRSAEEVLGQTRNTSPHGTDELNNNESVEATTALPEERYGSGPDQVEGRSGEEVLGQVRNDGSVQTNPDVAEELNNNESVETTTALPEQRYGSGPDQVEGRSGEEVLGQVRNDGSVQSNPDGTEGLDNKEAVLPEERYGSGPDQVDGRSGEEVLGQVRNDGSVQTNLDEVEELNANDSVEGTTGLPEQRYGSGPDQIEGKSVEEVLGQARNDGSVQTNLDAAEELNTNESVEGTTGLPEQRYGSGLDQVEGKSVEEVLGQARNDGSVQTNPDEADEFDNKEPVEGTTGLPEQRYGSGPDQVDSGSVEEVLGQTRNDGSVQTNLDAAEELNTNESVEETTGLPEQRYGSGPDQVDSGSVEEVLGQARNNESVQTNPDEAEEFDNKESVEGTSGLPEQRYGSGPDQVDSGSVEEVLGQARNDGSVQTSPDAAEELNNNESVEATTALPEQRYGSGPDQVEGKSVEEVLGQVRNDGSVQTNPDAAEELNNNESVEATNVLPEQRYGSGPDQVDSGSVEEVLGQVRNNESVQTNPDAAEELNNNASVEATTALPEQRYGSGPDQVDSRSVEEVLGQARNDGSVQTSPDAAEELNNNESVEGTTASPEGRYGSGPDQVEGKSVEEVLGQARNNESVQTNPDAAEELDNEAAVEGAAALPEQRYGSGPDQVEGKSVEEVLGQVRNDGSVETDPNGAEESDNKQSVEELIALPEQRYGSGPDQVGGRSVEEVLGQARNNGSVQTDPNGAEESDNKESVEGTTALPEERYGSGPDQLEVLDQVRNGGSTQESGVRSEQTDESGQNVNGITNVGPAQEEKKRSGFNWAHIWTIE